MLSELFFATARCQVWDSVLGTITEANRIMGDVGSHQGVAIGYVTRLD